MRRHLVLATPLWACSILFTLEVGNPIKICYEHELGPWMLSLGYGGGVSHPPLVLESGLLTQEDWTRRMSVALFKPCLSSGSATQVDIDMILAAVRC